MFLQSVLNRAARLTRPDGSRVLEANPLKGYVRPRNRNPRRPVATYDRYLAVRAHADAADPQQRFGSFLDLIEALGWRVTAICELRGADVDFAPQRRRRRSAGSGSAARWTRKASTCGSR